MTDLRDPKPAAGAAPGARDVEPGTLRRLLLGLVLLGIVGLGAELLLLEHFDGTAQWVPLVTLPLAFACTVAAALRPSRAVLRLFQGVMAALVVAGALGVYFHLRGNIEFEREMDASLRGLDLLWKSLHGATPALAPGAMAQLGLLGLACAYRHPALQGVTPRPSPGSRFPPAAS